MTGNGDQGAKRMGPEAAALAPKPQVPGTQAISSRGKAVADEDPVADVLEWLGRYDFRESSQPPSGRLRDISDEGGSDEMMASLDAAQAQLPRTATASKSREPGRLLQPPGTKTTASMTSASPSASSASASATSPAIGNVASLSAAAASPTSTVPDDAAQKAGNAGNPQPAAAGRCGERSPMAWMLCKTEDDKGGAGRDFFEEEEEEWDQRQQKSGTVGRLVVYHAGDNPREDVVLRGGGRRHIVVAGIREGGQAARVGVRAGDRLVSIDGKKDFLGQSADDVREQLEAPAVLVFLGFVGKLQAEVRLTCQDHVCGISTRQEVVKGSSDAPLTLCEERVINAGFASLFLTVADKDQPDHETDADGKVQPVQQLPMFELQHKEAHSLVKRALRRLEAKELLSKATMGNSAAGPIVGSPTPPHISGQYSTPTSGHTGLESKDKGPQFSQSASSALPSQTPQNSRTAIGGMESAMTTPGLPPRKEIGKSPFTPVYSAPKAPAVGSPPVVLNTTKPIGPELHHVI